MTSIDEYASTFSEEPGYLDFARLGPIGSAVEAEENAQLALLGHARYGSLAALAAQEDRVGEALAAVTGFPAEQIVCQPNTSQGLMHAMFGITGGVALSAADFPSLPFAAARAAEALGVLRPVWLDTDHGRVTPGNLRDQLDSGVAAVAVSLVDYRTGFLADLEGIRQVIGDRLLIVDVIQGLGVVDAPLGVADIIVGGGQKFVRAGWGTGFMALSDRALGALTPVWSGSTGIDGDATELDEVVPPSRSAAAFRVGGGDPLAQARLAAALEQIAAVGVPAIRERITELVGRVIDLADRFAVRVTSPRDEAERAAIVVLEPDPDQLTVLTASLHNHGVTATTRRGSVRLAVHASTTEETLDMLDASLAAYAFATNP